MSDALLWSTVTATGPDARSFLDGQLSQDLREVGDGVWSLVLDPQGTVLSTAFVRGDDETFELLVPRALSADVETRLRRFLIRVRCTLVTTDDAVRPPLQNADELFDAGWPWTDELASGLAPHSFGPTFVARTISLTKGCFTGQELVGRMDARGATMPWRFVRARGASLAAIEETLRGTGPAGPQGVTRSRERGVVVEALGFAHRTLLSANAVHDIDVEAID